MKYKYVFIFVIINIITIIHLSGQLNIDDENQTDGIHFYYDDVIINAPGNPPGEIDYSASAEVLYKSTGKICLKPGFTAGNFDQEGSFNAVIGQYIFDDVSIDPDPDDPGYVPVEKYKKVEITINPTQTFSNPYDPDEIDLYAEFTSPSGVTYNIPGFYYEEINRLIDSDYGGLPFPVEYLESTGNFCWKIIAKIFKQ